jgi:tocopherol O-methyltransferase
MRTTPTLNRRIKEFYDASTRIWLDTWGEHMHHGHYGSDGKTKKNHGQAQLDMIDEMLRWGEVTQASRILDAGCGVGGSARLLAQRFDASALGLTLSPVQVERAQMYTEHAGQSEKVAFQVRDMMELKAEDGPFDLIWSMESAEHIADKQALFERFYEVLAPGGKLLMATWCHRPPEPPLTNKETQLLERVYELYHLPPMVPLNELERMAGQAGFQQIQTDDWSDAVSPFWGAVIRSALSMRSITGLIRSGWPTIKGAWAMQYMQRGYRKGLIQFGVLQGEKA